MNEKSASLVSKQVLLPFILVTSLFALWGFANDITNPMVATFGTLMELSNAKAAWVQLAFYGGYATMAIPAAIFVRRFNYKKGIVDPNKETVAWVNESPYADKLQLIKNQIKKVGLLNIYLQKFQLKL